MRSETHLHFFYAEELINTLLGAETEGSPFYHMFSVVLSAPPPCHLRHLEPECHWYLCDTGLSIHCYTFKLNSHTHTHTHTSFEVAFEEYGCAQTDLLRSSAINSINRLGPEGPKLIQKPANSESYKPT